MAIGCFSPRRKATCTKSLDPRALHDQHGSSNDFFSLSNMASPLLLSMGMTWDDHAAAHAHESAHDCGTFSNGGTRFVSTPNVERRLRRVSGKVLFDVWSAKVCCMFLPLHV